MNTPTPPGDVSVTAPGCPACGQPLPAGRSRPFCSPACRQAAYRRRNQPLLAKCPCRAAGYECTECETRYLAEQWCPDCSRPSRGLTGRMDPQRMVCALKTAQGSAAPARRAARQQ